MKHSAAAVKAHPAPAVGEGEDYALACKAVHDARVAFDAPKLTAAQKLERFGMDAICVMVAEVTPMRTIAETIGVSWATLDRYIRETPERIEQYACAREAQADKMADDIMQIVDEPPMITMSGSVDSGDVAHKRLRMDARRWLAGKMAPKKYGDKLAVGGADDLPPVQFSEIVRKIVKS